MATPELLREAVERAIMTYDPIRTSETHIDIAVESGGITLSGYVRTDTMRSVASQLARAVPGVRSVRNNLYSDTDLEIMASQAIELRLGTLIVPMMPVVRAIRGHLFLRGPVPSESAKQIIEEAVRMVPGVAMAHNLLDVDPEAIERLIAPKKAAVAARAGGAGGGQAMVGGKPVTEADLPTWAMKPKSQWSQADYKTRAKAKLAFKRSEGPDPKEMEEAGAILRGGGGEAEPEPEPTPAAAPVAEAAAPEVEEVVEDTPSAPVDLSALSEQFPAWALKPKEEWTPEDFKGQMAAKRAAKTGAGEDPAAIIEKAQAALAAAQSAGKKKTSGGPKNAQEAAIAAVRQQYPGWAILPRKEWKAQDFQEAADARVAELRGKGKATKDIRTEAQAALEAALRGEAVAGGGGAKRRDLTPEESAAVRQGLSSEYPGWALKAKEEWDPEDFKGQMAAKRAAKTGGEAPESTIERAQAALKSALQAAWEALPLVGGDDAPAAAPAGPRVITPELLARYPGWALKAKEEWDGDDFKAHSKAKSAFKKGAGPDPDALIAEAQAALG